MNNDKKYYVMRYSSEESGCPVFLSGFFNHEEFEWDAFEPNPESIHVKNNYSLELSGAEVELDSLDFDFYEGGGLYVSKAFLSVCDRLGVKYKAVPLEITIGKRSRPHDFYIFLPGDSLSALDRPRSVYKVSKDLDSGEEIKSPIYPDTNSIDSIEFFLVLPNLESDLFRCQETFEIFCSERFRSEADLLKGISFFRVDDQYRYDAWAAFDDV